MNEPLIINEKSLATKCSVADSYTYKCLVNLLTSKVGNRHIVVFQSELATKSLSALRSRKGEIIDSLEDLVGKDETQKISHATLERATTLQNLQTLTSDDRQGYSMWSSQVRLVSLYIHDGSYVKIN